MLFPEVPLDPARGVKDMLAPRVRLEHIRGIIGVWPELAECKGSIVAIRILGGLRLVPHQLAVLNQHVPVAQQRYYINSFANTGMHFRYLS